MKLNSKKILAKIIYLSAVLLWVSTIFSSLFLPEKIIGAIYPFCKLFFSGICHQKYERTFIFNNIPLYVCARCTGIYVGAAVAAVFCFFKEIKMHNKYLLFTTIPIIFDVCLYNLKVYNYNKFIALFTGLLFGFAISYKTILEFINYLFEHNEDI